MKIVTTKQAALAALSAPFMAVMITACGGGPDPSVPASSICRHLTEVTNDVNTVQQGPIDNEPAELQAIRSALSGLTAQTSRQSNDLATLNQQFTTMVTDSSDGNDEIQSAILTGISDMSDTLNALGPDCSGS